MSDSNKPQNEIEKTLSEQIIEKMIYKLQQSEHFTDSLLSELKGSDLTDKNSVKEIISKQIKGSEK